jgi:hypothetical protein
MLLQAVLDPTKVLPADFFTFMLPWVLTFAIVYGLLDKLEIFGDLKDKVNIILSIIFAFFVTAAAGPQMAAFFSAILGNFVVVATGIIVLLIFLKIGGHDLISDKNNKSRNNVVIFTVFILGVLLFFGSGGTIPGLKFDSTTSTFIFWGLILFVAIYYVQKPKE